MLYQRFIKLNGWVSVIICINQYLVLSAITIKMYKAGSIRKIEVKNFVTYSHVEMIPGPQLNMIIGPNGTGKSTMVAAIILGLGGNPKVVGRGTKISEYVKHNCDSSTINIILQGETENSYIKVTREFDKRDKTSWKLNSRKVKIDEVMTCIRKFNIQVDNLCQFLPQDKVQDFAKLNKQDLLKETQRALCRIDLIEKQDMLINSRVRHKELMGTLDNHRKKLQETQDANARLEGRVQNFNTKKKYTESVLHIERKIAWTTYEDIRGKLVEIKNDKTNAHKVYDQFKSSLEPMEQQINNTKKQVTSMQHGNSRTVELIRNTESTINLNFESVDGLKSSIRTVEDDTNSKVAEIEQWEAEIENAVSKLQEMKTLKEEIRAKCEANEREKASISSELTKLLSQQKRLQDQTDDMSQAKQDNIRKVHTLENEMNRLENVKHNRLQELQRRNQDAYKAVCWLRNNKHLFESEIYEPMMLEINVLDVRQAKYLENFIPLRDRLAFTCISKKDMGKLVRSLRENQNLCINVVHSGDGENMSQFQPKMPIERLRKFGFYTYLNNLFTAPEPIVRYLCKTYNIHNIPVGDQTTNTCYDQVPSEIRNFFSDKYRYSISFSKYSGHKSTKQVEIFSDGGLSLSLDIVRLENLKGQMADLRKSIQNHESEMETYQSQLTKMNEKISALRDKGREFQRERQHAQAIDSRIEGTERQIAEMRRNKKSPEVIRSEGKQKIKQVIGKIFALQQAIRNETKKLSDLIVQSSLTTLKIEESRKSLSYLESKIGDNRKQCQEAEDTLNRIKDKYAEVMNQAKGLLNKAKGLSNGFTPADDGFDEFRAEYDKLSCDVQRLNVEKEQLQSRIACLNTADDGEMREYEERLQQIKKLAEDIETHTTELNKVSTRMERMQEEWLTPLNQLVAEINLKFATAFERMGCAGEVSVCAGDNDKDFSQYGLSIKVTYRNGEPLQELNRNVQSGGERAVATAAFMLSLQELTPVPFRCVDEVNQGMDINNERRIFELIVETTCQEASSQYFLITPKLVPHLNYSRNMTVHIVHNGPFVAQDKKWGFTKLCNPLGVQIA